MRDCGRVTKPSTHRLVDIPTIWFSKQFHGNKHQTFVFAQNGIVGKRPAFRKEFDSMTSWSIVWPPAPTRPLSHCLQTISSCWFSLCSTRPKKEKVLLFLIHMVFSLSWFDSLVPRSLFSKRRIELGPVSFLFVMRVTSKNIGFEHFDLDLLSEKLHNSSSYKHGNTKWTCSKMWHKWFILQSHRADGKQEPWSLVLSGKKQKQMHPRVKLKLNYI